MKAMVAIAAVAVLSLCASCDGCDDGAIDDATADAGLPGGLTPKQAKEVVAKVGDRTITLGDYAAALERMNRIDRLRYQTRERRRELLDEMIDLELLAQEAKRRGLDDKPEVQEAVRQVLREALLAKARADLPAPGAIPIEQVKAYYEEHQAEYSEPERRRVSVIVMTDREAAEAVLKQAREGAKWGPLWGQHDLEADPKKAAQAGDLAGDLGIVGAPGEARGNNDAVPAPVRKVLFTLKEVGDIHAELVEHEGKLYIVRLSGRTEGHTRSLEEADRSIRVALLRDRVKELEKKLEDDLRQRFPVDIDDKALEAVKVPDVSNVRPFWEKTLPPDGEPQDGLPAPAPSSPKGP